MDKITIKAPAKINLWLDVLGKRSDGFHEIDSVMQTVSLHDIITVSKNDTGKISVHTCGEYIPFDFPNEQDNIAYKTALLFLGENCYLNNGVDITIEKNIPIGAGLAGGSTDAAAVLIALNILFNTCYTEDKLCEMGAEIGSDVPFCIKKGTVRVKGRGEVLCALPDIKISDIVIAIGEKSVSTKEAYALVDNCQKEDKPQDISRLLCGDICSLYNSFEKPISTVVENITDIKDTMSECNSLASLMSGSGPSVFGIFENSKDAENAFSKLRCKGYRAFICESVFGDFE